MRNIHIKEFSADDDVSSVDYVDKPVSQGTVSTAVPEPTAEVRLKLRKVAVSPAEEYALRPGQVQPISDSLAAIILHRGGRVEVTLKGVVIERKDMGGRCTYWHPDSRVCSDLSYRSRKIYYSLNIHRPEVIHLLDENGEYLESLPLKNRPAVLDNAAQEKEARANNRAIRRISKHMQNIHAPDTAADLEDLRHNAAAAGRAYVQTLPAPGSAAAAPVQPARSEMGDAIAAAERDVLAGSQNYERNPLPPLPRKSSTRSAERKTNDLTETAAAILARRGGIKVDCPY